MSAGWRTAGLRQGRRVHACGAGSAYTAVAYRGTSGRERGGLGGKVVVLQAYSSDEAGEFNSEKGPIEDGEACCSGGLGVHRAVVARGARARRGQVGVLTRATRPASSTAGARGRRGLQSRRAQRTAGAWHERQRGAGSRWEGCRLTRAMRTARPEAARGRARRALFVVLVILKKRSGSPPKR